MTGNICCVNNCRQFSHDEDGKSVKNGLTFFSFPAWRRNEGRDVSALTMRRRSAWVAAVGRSDISFDHVPISTRVCSRHFHSGKPAYERLQSDPDWAPSLELGHGEGNGRYTERVQMHIRDKESKKTEKKTKKEPKETVKKRRLEISRPPGGEAKAEAAGGGAKTGVGGPVKATQPWSEVRSLLLSVLKHPPISNQRPADQTHKEAVHAEKETDFRDFFRKSLEESLENFSKSRTPPTEQPPIYVELKEDLSLRILPVKKTSKEPSSSSSSCKNCERLQRKVFELHEELSHLTGGQDDMDVTPVSKTTYLHTDQVPQSPETAQTEEEVPDWAESLEGGHKNRKKSSSSSRSHDNIRSSKYKPLRFKKVWLRMFDFLRFSPSLNIMWCHICRLYHDKKHKDHGMIKGSRSLKLDNVKAHSTSIYHKANMERYMKHMSDLKLSDSNCSNRESEENI